MVFKVFCDVNVSCITNEDIYNNEDISYDFIPKFDDNKENWDPKASKKNCSNSITSIDQVTSKKVDKKEDNKKDKYISLLLNDKEFNININNKKGGKEINEKKIECQEQKEHNNKKSEKEIDKVENKSNKEVDLTKNTSEAVESLSSNDTTKFNNEEENNSTVATLQKKSLLGKRERVPLEDITYLFVPEKRIIIPKRKRLVKNEVEYPSPKIILNVKKCDKSISIKENKESMKIHNVYSDNSKENVKPKHKTPLSNISNRSNINNNNNNNSNIKKLNNNNNNNNNSNIPKPFFVNVRKNKPVKKNNIPKKTLKSKQNSYNVSARMLR